MNWLNVNNHGIITFGCVEYLPQGKIMYWTLFISYCKAFFMCYNYAKQPITLYYSQLFFLKKCKDLYDYGDDNTIHICDVLGIYLIMFFRDTQSFHGTAFSNSHSGLASKIWGVCYLFPSHFVSFWECHPLLEQTHRHNLIPLCVYIYTYICTIYGAFSRTRTHTCTQYHVC
mgnify:FL=1